MERVPHEVFPAIAPERFAAQMAIFEHMREIAMAKPAKPIPAPQAPKRH